MAIPFDSLPRASFDGDEFCCEGIRIIGGLRDHVNEYVHVDGGDPEKLGRKLYIIEMDVVFTTDHPNYPGAWPGTKTKLIQKFEKRVTASLLVPTVGTIPVYAVDWPVEHRPNMRNGERMKARFREHQKKTALANPLKLNFTNVAKLSADLVLIADDLGLELDVFESIQALANQLQGLVDQADLQADIISLKAEQLADACRTLDSIDKRLRDPVNHRCMRALHRLGVAAGNIVADSLGRLLPTRVFVVPTLMSIVDVSIAIYGTTSRAMELMRMNALQNPFAIHAGTRITHYIVAGTLQAA